MALAIYKYISFWWGGGGARKAKSKRGGLQILFKLIFK